MEPIEITVSTKDEKYTAERFTAYRNALVSNEQEEKGDH